MGGSQCFNGGRNESGSRICVEERKNRCPMLPVEEEERFVWVVCGIVLIEIMCLCTVRRCRAFQNSNANLSCCDGCLSLFKEFLE